MIATFNMPYGFFARQALDLIDKKTVRGIPAWLINPLEHAHIDRLAGMPEGSYVKNPVPVYTRMLQNTGCSLIDQFIPKNPLTMGRHGYDADSSVRNRATTGSKDIVLDGIRIDSPEAVVNHLERRIFPALLKQTETFDATAAAQQVIEHENAIQKIIGNEMLKVPYDLQMFPRMGYGTYGYENYFMAYALYPEVIEKHFALQADLAVKSNTALAHAYLEGGLPKLLRLDHDLADQKGTLVDIRTLDRLWFPHFERSIQPLLKAGVTLLWHCDGNLMQMFPRLIRCGVGGLQGFQYEYGVDYEKICRMKTREGQPLFIIGGVSVTRTLPFGTPAEVKREMRWLVEEGPKTGLVLGASSSITPGVPWENMKTFVEGLRHYQEHGRG